MNYKKYLEDQLQTSIEAADHKSVYYALLHLTKELCKEKTANQGTKKIYYISAEFLIGKLLSNNLINLGIYDDIKNLLHENGKSLEEIEEFEPEPSLGNGGLGRLAACFLDSIATLGLPGAGIGLNYHYGLFRQVFENNKQKELKNPWIEKENWLIKTDVHFPVQFGSFTLQASMYDIDIPGYGNGINKLHLFDADSIDESLVTEGIHFNKENIAKNLTLFLYPDDSDKAGHLLRIYQQYFMVCCGAKLILKELKEQNFELTSLPEHVVIQINETHPALAMPELMRILMDEEDFGWDEAYGMVKKIFHYTNHTIMTEAMECWDENMFRLLLPRIYQIICAINEKYCQKLSVYYSKEEEKIAQMAVIGNNEIRMANLCVALCRRINGVSNLHADILKTRIFKGSYQIFPQKYLAITNGITHRRWLALANQGLYHLVREYVKGDILKDYRLFEQILPYKDDKEFCKKYEKVKRNNKIRFAKYIKEKQGIEVNPESIFDVHCKRLHEYKRQLLKCLHIIYIYQKIKKDPTCITTPITFIFAAKAAPGYARAKEIIRLIHSIQEMVNKDPDMDGKIQVVFVENYCVSVAEILIPAADISEQISTAGMEASGTGNMKFMMNGALTIGTMDGANIEIAERVGQENIFIFGDSAEGNYNKKCTIHTIQGLFSRIIQESVMYVIV